MTSPIDDFINGKFTPHSPISPEDIVSPLSINSFSSPTPKSQLNFAGLDDKTSTISVTAATFKKNQDPFDPLEKLQEEGRALWSNKPRTRDGKRRQGFLNSDGFQMYQPSLRHRGEAVRSSSLYGSTKQAAAAIYNFDAFINPTLKEQLRLQKAERLRKKQEQEEDEDHEDEDREAGPHSLSRAQHGSSAQSIPSIDIDTSSELVETKESKRKRMIKSTQNIISIITPLHQTAELKAERELTLAANEPLLGPYYTSLFREVCDIVGYDLEQPQIDSYEHVEHDISTITTTPNNSDFLELNIERSASATSVASTTSTASQYQASTSTITTPHKTKENEPQKTPTGFAKHIDKFCPKSQKPTALSNITSQNKLQLLHTALTKPIRASDFNANRARLLAATLARGFGLSILRYPQPVLVPTADFDTVEKWIWVDQEGLNLFWGQKCPDLDKKPNLFKRIFHIDPHYTSQEVLRIDRINLGVFQRGKNSHKKSALKPWHCITITFNNVQPKAEKSSSSDEKGGKDNNLAKNDTKSKQIVEPLQVLEPIEIVCHDDDQTRLLFMGLQALSPLSSNSKTYGAFLWKRSSLKMRKLAFDKVLLKEEYAQILWEQAKEVKFQRFKKYYLYMKRLNALRYSIAQLSMLCASQVYYEFLNGLVRTASLTVPAMIESQLNKTIDGVKQQWVAHGDSSQHHLEIDWSRIDQLISLSLCASAVPGTSNRDPIFAAFSEKEIQSLSANRNQFVNLLEMCFVRLLPLKYSLSLPEVQKARFFLKHYIRQRFVSSLFRHSQDAIGNLDQSIRQNLRIRDDHTMNQVLCGLVDEEEACLFVDALEKQGSSSSINFDNNDETTTLINDNTAFDSPPITNTQKHPILLQPTTTSKTPNTESLDNRPSSPSSSSPSSPLMEAVLVQAVAEGVSHQTEKFIEQSQDEFDQIRRLRFQTISKAKHQLDEDFTHVYDQDVYEARVKLLQNRKREKDAITPSASAHPTSNNTANTSNEDAQQENHILTDEFPQPGAISTLRTINAVLDLSLPDLSSPNFDESTLKFVPCDEIDASSLISCSHSTSTSPTSQNPPTTSAPLDHNIPLLNQPSLSRLPTVSTVLTPEQRILLQEFPQDVVQLIQHQVSDLLDLDRVNRLATEIILPSPVLPSKTLQSVPSLSPSFTASSSSINLLPNPLTPRTSQVIRDKLSINYHGDISENLLLPPDASSSTPATSSMTTPSPSNQPLDSFSLNSPSQQQLPAILQHHPERQKMMRTLTKLSYELQNQLTLDSNRYLTDADNELAYYSAQTNNSSPSVSIVPDSYEAYYNNVRNFSKIESPPTSAFALDQNLHLSPNPGLLTLKKQIGFDQHRLNEYDLDTIEFLQHCYRFQLEQALCDYGDTSTEDPSQLAVKPSPTTTIPSNHKHPQPHFQHTKLLKSNYKVIEFIAYLRAAMYPRLTGFERELVRDGAVDINILIGELLNLSPDGLNQDTTFIDFTRRRY